MSRDDSGSAIFLLGSSSDRRVAVVLRMSMPAPGQVQKPLDVLRMFPGRRRMTEEVDCFEARDHRWLLRGGLNASVYSRKVVSND